MSAEAAPRIRLATIWLEGCSGCHMSFLDMDDRLIELAGRVDIVYSPYVDAKEFPQGVDVALIEGAIGSEGDLKKLRMARSRTGCLVALGDCAVTGNVPAMRNMCSVCDVMATAYQRPGTLQPQTPDQVIPALRPQVRPLHDAVKVDVFVPGCPPSADLIHAVLTELLAGRVPGREFTARFG